MTSTAARSSIDGDTYHNTIHRFSSSSKNELNVRDHDYRHCHALLHRTHRPPEWHHSTRLLASSRTHTEPSLYGTHSRRYENPIYAIIRNRRPIPSRTTIVGRDDASRSSQHYCRPTKVPRLSGRSRAEESVAPIIADWQDAHTNRTTYTPFSLSPPGGALYRGI